jgi:septum formation protein
MSASSLFITCQPLILASASPRRKEFLSGLGLEFAVITSPVDETPTPGELPEKFAVRMAQAKAQAVSLRHPRSWIIGADTVVTLDSRTILGKPAGRDDALAILRQLRGTTHQVMTGLCLCCLEKKMNTSLVESTAVTFVDASDDILRAYIATGEPLDKAGAYGIQGTGSFLVTKIVGSCSNVIGLPVSRLVSLLTQHKVISPAAGTK